MTHWCYFSAIKTAIQNNVASTGGGVVYWGCHDLYPWTATIIFSTAPAATYPLSVTPPSRGFAPFADVTAAPQ